VVLLRAFSYASPIFWPFVATSYALGDRFRGNACRPLVRWSPISCPVSSVQAGPVYCQGFSLVRAARVVSRFWWFAFASCGTGLEQLRSTVPTVCYVLLRLASAFACSGLLVPGSTNCLHRLHTIFVLAVPEFRVVPCKGLQFAGLRRLRQMHGSSSCEQIASLLREPQFEYYDVACRCCTCSIVSCLADRDRP
jgi:hypothetical protein